MDSDKHKNTLSEEYKKKLKDQTESSQTVIAQSTQIKGSITCQDQLLVLGMVEGDIDCAGLVWVEKKAKVNANVFARKVVIEGELNGNIESAEYVEIKPEGRLIGNLKAAKIRLIQGCVVDGEVSNVKITHEKSPQK
jgi:cytoskeletal protein CcmA (bactofilin family)